MAKFMHIKIDLMAEITDIGALREAALTKFDTDDTTSDDYPDTADWHASEEAQEERRLIATEDKTALYHLVDPAKVNGLLDDVPAARSLGMRMDVDELEGTTRREALYSTAAVPSLPIVQLAATASRAAPRAVASDPLRRL
jgi:hypothetical protein